MAIRTVVTVLVLLHVGGHVSGQVDFDRAVCLEAPQMNRCRAAIQMYFFNSTSGQCDEFIWGGCPGSFNRFPTREACIHNCNPEACALPPEVGPCRANIKLWFYDITHRKCNEFSYGGCYGNANKFGSRTSCETACAGTNLGCELGDTFETLGTKSVHTNYREKEWYTSSCNSKCRDNCLSEHPWGKCLAYSTRKRWYVCHCYLYDRHLSTLEFDDKTAGVTRNRGCADSGAIDDEDDY